MTCGLKSEMSKSCNRLSPWRWTFVWHYIRWQERENRGRRTPDAWRHTKDTVLSTLVLWGIHAGEGGSHTAEKLQKIEDTVNILSQRKTVNASTGRNTDSMQWMNSSDLQRFCRNLRSGRHHQKFSFDLLKSASK